ncbi:MAG: T9SS type A sorting domain-containing protein [candidate division KSB1 bacterium]|nr:T9SS type A sorting domain-containing protein [candidate division KSB1 bacterium]
MSSEKHVVLVVTILVMAFSGLLAQQAGDYRSLTTGNWSNPATWEMFDGSQWVAASAAPTGAEQITVKGTDTVKVDVAVEMQGYLKVQENGVVTVTTGSLAFAQGSTYEHARNGGSVPLAVWGEGSTALFTGITNSAPANRGQNYHHVVLNTPNLSSNLDLNLAGKVIAGDIRVVSSGSSRWRLVGGTSGTLVIMGDVIVEGGQLETQGTSSSTQVLVEHYGNVRVTGGNFSVSRGSQGGAGGTGWTRWYLHQGDFLMSNATTQNSNPWRATFIFAKLGGVQNLVLENVTYGAGGLPVQVDSGATLNMGNSRLGGDGSFVISPGAGLQTALPGGLDEAIGPVGSRTILLSKQASYTFNGVLPQVPGVLLPDTVRTLTVANPQGVTLNDTLRAQHITVSPGCLMYVEALGSVTADSGGVEGTVVNRGALVASDSIYFAPGSVYQHDRDGGSLPNGIWAAGSTFLLTGTIQDAPANRNQNFANVVFNTPNLGRNRDMGWKGVTISGDIHVVNTGSYRWHMSSIASGDTAVITVLGDVRVESGQFAVQGTSTGNTTFIVHHYGDVLVTGGNFSIARGSQGGSGTTTWYLHEGDFSMANATTQNSNPTPGNAKFVFAKTGVQHLALGDNNTIQNLPIEVLPGTTLDVGVSSLAGNGVFILNDGATLATAHPGGVAGFLGTLPPNLAALSTAANYTFNGVEPQVTSAALPTVVQDLTIANPAGVTLTQETTVNGVLHLVAGELDNTVPFGLGPAGSVSFEGGSLRVPLVAAEYRSLTSGDWSAASTWEAYLFDRWMPAPMPPSGTERITVDNNDTVRVDVPVEVRGHLKVQDQAVVEVSTGSLAFVDTSIYEHARDAGAIPIATWGEGSTLLLTGTVQDAPANRNQNFYHVVFNTPNLGRNRDMGWNGITIGGDIRVVNTGAYRWQMSTAAAGDSSVITVMGDVIVEGGAFSVQGTGNALTTFVVHHYGNIQVTGGNFSIARGSQGNGTGTTTWYLYEGDFSMANATTQNSNPTPGNAKFVFAKQGVQRLTLGEGNTIMNLPIQVSSGTTLDAGLSVLAGNGIFVLDDGATLALAHEGGVAGFLGTLPNEVVTLSTSANYSFNGTARQVTSTRMPTVVHDLTINNQAGVVLSQQTTINGVLHLVAGEFDNTIPFTLGPTGSISYEGGSLKVSVSVREVADAVPTTLALLQNYPNPFNPLTTIGYQIPAATRVTLTIFDAHGREVARLVDRVHAPGSYAAVWDASQVASGVYYCRLLAGGTSLVRKLVVAK